MRLLKLGVIAAGMLGVAGCAPPEPLSPQDQDFQVFWYNAAVTCVQLGAVRDLHSVSEYASYRESVIRHRMPPAEQEAAHNRLIQSFPPYPRVTQNVCNQVQYAAIKHVQEVRKEEADRAAFSESMDRLANSFPKQASCINYGFGQVRCTTY